HPVTPMLIVNGPIAKEMGWNGGYNAFGRGGGANLRIGRALRLGLLNVGGGRPGPGDGSPKGKPARTASCMARNRKASPGKQLHVEAGWRRDASTVTAVPCEGPHNIQDHFSTTGLGILRTIAGAMGQAGSNNLLDRGWPILSLGPEHAATIARDGYDKQAIKAFIFEHGRFPLGRLGAEYRRMQIERHQVVDDDATMIPIVQSPDAITVIAVGGAGKHSSWQPTFGRQTRPATRLIGRSRAGS